MLLGRVARAGGMSLAIVHARAALGVEAPRVNIEVHLSGGLPGTNIVGLPEAAVRVLCRDAFVILPSVRSFLKRRTA